jgi:hypothetical protein
MTVSGRQGMGLAEASSSMQLPTILFRQRSGLCRDEGGLRNCKMEFHHVPASIGEAQPAGMLSNWQTLSLLPTRTKFWSAHPPEADIAAF